MLKDKLPSDNTETFAVSALDMVVSSTKSLSSQIKKGDRGPLWDGDILVFDSENHACRNLTGRIPVQVKGGNVERFSKKATYPVEVLALEKYLEDGGLIYFVVHRKPNAEYMIFYKLLLPLDIQKLLQRAKGVSISIHLNELNKSKPQQLKALCNYFLEHKRKQIGKNVIMLEDIQTITNLSGSIFASTPSEAEKLFMQGDFYTYKEIDDDVIPVIIPAFSAMQRTIAAPVSVMEHEFFCSYGFKTIKNETILVFGNQLEINLTTNTITINYKGPCKDVLLATEFVCACIKSEQFEVNGTVFPFLECDSDKSSTFLKENINRRNQLRDLSFVLDNIGIPQDIELDSISKNQWDTVIALKQIITNHNPGKYNINNSISRITISDKTALVIFFKTENEAISVLNFFDRSLHEKLKFAVESDEKEFLPVTPYVLLNKDDIMAASNLNCEVVLGSIKLNKLYKDTEEDINRLLLSFISAFDKTGRPELLSLAEAISDISFEYSPGNVYAEINKYQILRRTGELSKKIKHRLVELKSKHQSDAFICAGICAVLGYETEFELYFDKLDQQEKDNFVSFPIFYYAKDWIAL